MKLDENLDGVILKKIVYRLLSMYEEIALIKKKTILNQEIHGI